MVDLTNLQRQIAHAVDRLGQPKVRSAATAIASLNPEVRVVAMRARADPPMLGTLVAAADVVVDCSDNYATRHAVNAACVQHARPLVSGAAIRFDGQVSVFDTRAADAPCYACVFPADAAFEETACSTLGVFAPLVGIVGSMQAAETLKLLAGIGRTLAGRLQMLDARTMEWTEMRLRRQAACPVCGTRRAGDSPHASSGRHPRRLTAKAESLAAHSAVMFAALMILLQRWTSSSRKAANLPARAHRRGSPGCARALRAPG